ncbi:hypothetical protein ACEPAG_8052 [Sanghuangporus baumii]
MVNRPRLTSLISGLAGRRQVNRLNGSGVTAGMDMASAFLVHLVGEDVVQIIRDIIELSGRASDDDEFAAVHGLLGD